MASRRVRRRADRSSSSGSEAEEATLEQPAPPLQPEEVIFRDMTQQLSFNGKGNADYLSTKYACATTMTQLNIIEDIIRLCTNIGMGYFIQQQWPTYPLLCQEFFSSFRARHLDPKSRKTPRVEFRLFNREYRLNLADLNEAYRFPPLAMPFVPGAYEANAFWEAITAEARFQPARAKASLIQNPVFRYMHRIISLSITGRSESDGAINRTELMILWAAYHGVELNLAEFLAITFRTYADRDGGKVVVGGLVTPIALYLGLDLSGLEMRPPALINFTAAKNMGLVTITPTGPAFRFRHRTDTLLCSEGARSTCFDRNNWLYFPCLKEPVILAGAPEEHPAEEQSEQPALLAGTEPAGDFVPEPSAAEFTEPPPAYTASSASTFDFSIFQGYFQEMQTSMAAIRADQARLLEGQTRLFQGQARLEARLSNVEEISRRYEEYHIAQGHYSLFPPSPPPPAD